MAKTLSFYLGEESRLYIENSQNYRDSIFSDIYNVFFNELRKDLPTIRNEERIASPDQSPSNNIYAFIGDRGAGKTSCMMSIAQILKNEDKSSDVFSNDTKFLVLDSIDPSFFDVHTNILDIFLGRLFSHFSDTIEKSNNVIPFAEKETVLEAFQKVKRTLTLANDHCIREDSGIDQLLSLQSTVELRKDIGNLVQSYLKFSKNQILVIPIDDIDLHSACAYRMVEEIRKYLVQYNIIVLMALKLDQLDYVIKKEYLETYSKLIDKDFLQIDSIADMASKYLVKLLPTTHRYILPSVENLNNANVNIYEKDDQATNGISMFNHHWKQKPGSGKYPARYELTKEIFEKTRYLFYHSKGVTSPIVPKSLREFNHLFGLLQGMKNYGSCSNEEKLNNKKIFKDYFLSSWCRSNLSASHSAFIKDLFEEFDPSIINKRVIQYLSSDKVLNRQNKSKLQDIGDIINEFNVSYNVTLGDVLKTTNQLKRLASNKEEKNFFFAIETFYSMRLYEYYDLRTEDSQKQEQTDIEQKIKTNSLLDSYEMYDLLVGGSFINIDDDNSKLISASLEHGRRDQRYISLKKIRSNCDQWISENNHEKLMLIELFALMISRRYYDNVTNYRTVSDVLFGVDFSSTQEWVSLDITSIFFNINRIKECYNRIDSRLYDIACNNSNSLIKKLQAFAGEHHKHATGHELLSCVAIRNIEVLNDFAEFLKTNYARIKFGEDDVENLNKFFTESAKYNIGTYLEKDDNENQWNKIDFNFIEILNQVFEPKENNDSFKEMFNEVKPDQQEKKAKNRKAASNKTNKDHKLELFLKDVNSSWLEDIQVFFDSNRSYKSNGEIKDALREFFKERISDTDNVTAVSSKLQSMVRVHDFPCESAKVIEIGKKIINKLLEMKGEGK